MTAPAAVRWRTCEDCGAHFQAPRKGRPRKTCDACRPARRKSRQPAVRLGRGASTNTGPAFTLHRAERFWARPTGDGADAGISGLRSTRTPHDGDLAQFWDLFYDGPGSPGAWISEQWASDNRRRRGSLDDTTKRYGLPPADDRRGAYGLPDRTCPELETIGQREGRWDWQETLDRERAWRA